MPGCVVGIDLTAALNMGEALGIEPLACAEFLPGIEVMMVRGLNEQMRTA